MKIALGIWGLLAVLIVLGIVALLYGVSMIIGLGLMALVLIVVGPNPEIISNYRQIWFWVFILGLGLVLLSATGFGFQMVDNTLSWVSPI